MLRELSVTLTGRPAHSGSLGQQQAAITNGEVPDHEGDDEEVSFDVKIEALSGEEFYLQQKV